MKSSIPRLEPWSVADSFGALFVVTVFVFIALTLWLGWPAVSAWVVSP
jgi:hypothetical protein